MASQFDFSNFDFSNIGNVFGNQMPGSAASGLDALLSEDQRKLMGRNAALSAAAALLQAGGRSSQRIGLGQALGSALQAGQQGYQQARVGSLQDLLLGQKIKDAQTEADSTAAFRKMLMGDAGETPVPLTPQMAALAAPTSVAGPAGPTVARAELADQMPTPTAAPAAGGMFTGLTTEQRALLGGMKPSAAISELFKIQQNQAAMTEEIAKEQRGYGAPQPEVINGKIVMVQYNKQGQSRIAQGVMPYEAQSPDIRAVEYIGGTPLAGTGQPGISAVGQYRQQIAPRTTVEVKPVIDMTGGQKGFENEMKLGSAFKAEPIYKDFSDMKSSFAQVISSLGAGTPIGDVAGATKIMKLLDPNSVVRESELAIAMAASGRMDRLQNYFSNMMSGQKLTPQQRDDFKSLGNELYAAAGQAYNNKRKEYEDFGNAYKFQNLGTALGSPAIVPSIMRGSGGTRPSLSNIFAIPGG